MRPNWLIATSVQAKSWVQPVRAISASDWKEYGVQVIVRSSGLFDTVRNADTVAARPSLGLSSYGAGSHGVPS
jgi:hypothetical protein